MRSILVLAAIVVLPLKIQASDWTGDVQLPFDSEFHWVNDGSNSVPIQRADLSKNVGTVTLGGQVLPAVMMAYLATNGVEVGGILATSRNEFLVVSIVCKDGVLTEVQYDTSKIQGDQEIKPSGICTFSTKQPVTSTVSLLPFGKLPDDRRRFDNIVIEGEKIHVSNSVGTIELGRQVYEVTVAGYYDFMDYPSAEHSEVYCIFTHEGEVRFAVLFLDKSHPERVRLNYGFRVDVPSLDPPDSFFKANWKVR